MSEWGEARGGKLLLSLGHTRTPRQATVLCTQSNHSFCCRFAACCVIATWRSFSFVTPPYACAMFGEKEGERRRRRLEKSQGLMHVRSRESKEKRKAAMCAWSCACVLCRPLSVCVGLGPVETCALAVAPSTRLCPCPPSLSQSCSPTVACVASECRAKAPPSLCAVCLVLC